jgi:hypothetical protein
MRLIPKSRMGCSIMAAVTLAALGLLVLLAHYRIQAVRAQILAAQEAFKASDYSEAYYRGESTKWWVTQLDDWFLDSQVFVGGGIVTLRYPRHGKPGRVDSNGKEPGASAHQLPLVLSGDPDAQPVLLAMLRARRNYNVHMLAIYGLVIIKEKTPETVAALESAATDDQLSFDREIIRDLSRQYGTDKPLKLTISGGEAAPKRP